ncbi:Gfo/Idh/MocA family protein [Acidisoma sp. L85]|uniref:Gfo/Idh/MocA family protein n=1 Tax=Acidisoma sp. L85 TaxID=1641850 RepID=UPI00131AD499|nr:Gfo/Idh/MocA family oxidoreductase [Acidisoma sp. L85]
MTKIAMLGAGFIGQMHALSFMSARMTRDLPVNPELTTLIETSANHALAENVAKRYGWTRTVFDDWEGALAERNHQLFVNAGPNFVHVNPSIVAAQAGAAIFSEKPLASTADEAHRLWKAVEQADVKHMCAFVHRFIPALRLARDMVKAGELGEIWAYRSQMLLDMREPDGRLTWRFIRNQAGGGATGDLGSHHIDVARFIVGEVVEVSGRTMTRLKNPSGDDAAVNDDSFSAIAVLDQGATATFEASRVLAGHALTGRIEIDGTKGTLAFSMERMNELVFTEPNKGPRTIMVTANTHPYGQFSLPVGIQGAHPIGWHDAFTFQAYHMLSAIEHGTSLDPDAATFRDGYRVAETVDAILRSAASRQVENVRFRN